MIPQIGFVEILLIAIIALIVVGPRDLPVLMRRAGQFIRKIKYMAQEFKSAFSEMDDGELGALKQEMQALREQGVLGQTNAELRADIDKLNTDLYEDRFAGAPEMGAGKTHNKTYSENHQEQINTQASDTQPTHKEGKKGA